MSLAGCRGPRHAIQSRGAEQGNGALPFIQYLMDIPEVRRRLRAAIEGAKSDTQQRRARIDAATREYETFLNQRAVPLFHTFAAALAAEGLRYKVFTPAGSVRLAAEGGADDYIELSLDTAGDQPQVIGRSSRGRGRRLVTTEQPIREGVSVESLTEEDVLDFLVREIQALVSS
jgi:hypothetical protein